MTSSLSQPDPNLALFKPLLAKVAAGQALSETEARSAFDIMMSGQANDAQIGGFLMALRVRGETIDELTAAATVMREKVTPISAPPYAIDTCGTGGDAVGTYNISTAAALVVAACGVPVAKHGNRALSSKSGSADVLAALGVNLEAPPATVERAIAEAGIGFMMAPRHHGAMRHVGPARVALGTRTIFNLLGPLSNPAKAKYQIIGVFNQSWVRPIAEVCGRLGSERVWVVHGADGLDELSTTGPSHVAEYHEGTIREFSVTPEQAGLPQGTLADLIGGSPDVNARAIQELLGGTRTAYRDIVVLNAAAALVVAGKADTLHNGARQAEAALDTGQARATLERMATLTHEAV